MLKPLTFGHFAVAVFIVLSGYCLMLPAAQSPQKRLRGSFWEYLWRRAKRILPPYYAAVALFLLVAALRPSLAHSGDVCWGMALPAFDKGVLLSHLLLVHNLSTDWSLRIAPPLWSVAVEWQIYFFLPLLVAVWRRAGIGVVVLIAFVAGSTPHFLFHGKMDTAGLHYIGLFALGAGAAVGNFSDAASLLSTGLRKFSLVIGGIALTISLLLLLRFQTWCWLNLWLIDWLIGVAVASLLFSLTAHLQNAKKQETSFYQYPLLLRFLMSKPVTTLGLFSYSLYLLHFPFLGLLHIRLLQENFSPEVRLLCLFGVGIPLCLGSAYLFYLVVERPFLKKTAAQTTNKPS